MSAVVLSAAFVGGLAVGRLAGMVAGRYTPPRGVRRHVPVLELSMAVTSIAVVSRFGVGWNMIPPMVAAASLMTLATVDLRVYRLPDAISLPALAVSLAAVAAASVAAGMSGAIVAAVAAALGLGAVLWAAHELRPSGLGFGDVKLGPLLGVHLGWVAGMFHPGWSAVLVLVAQALLLSCLIGVSTGVAVALLRRRGFDVLPDPHRGPPLAADRTRLLDTSFPFGPSLAAGTLAAVLFSEVLLR